VSIVNGTLDERWHLLEALNLTENPFIKTEPAERDLERVFVGRRQEMREVAGRVVDRPRNILVFGGYGCGKTTFVRKLLQELRSARSRRFLTGYAALGEDTPRGFQIAALAALCEGARSAMSEGPLHEFACETLEELGRLVPGERAVGSPDIRFRRGLSLAEQEGVHRVVLVIDEVDKRDPKVIKEILMGSRFLLDLGASFVLTGRYLDVFADIGSSLLAAFDHRVELKPFPDEEALEILRRNLAIARKTPEPEQTTQPFDEDVVARMVARARGLPRPLNLMASTALDHALDEAIESKTRIASITLGHLDRALQRQGNLIYNDVGAEARLILAGIFRRKGYASGEDLEALKPGGLPAVVKELEMLSRHDAVLRLEAADGPAFALSPQVEQNLRIESAKRERLRGLWKEAIDATEKVVRGRALEEFGATFFAEVFEVTARNLRTDTEELDLVLERSAGTDPRFTKSTYLIVECKNWRTQPVDQSAVTKLFGELALHSSQQGFLLTTGSFTEDARQQARYAVTQGVEIVLLDGPTLQRFLQELQSVNDLLVECHRRLVLRAG
jgi:hypothetical protein